MLNPNFVIVGAIISFIGALTYIVSTLKGQTKPNRVSWFIWALAPFIAFSAELSKGVGIQSLMTFMVGFNPLLIFLASFVNKKSEWKLGKLDFIMLSIAKRRLTTTTGCWQWAKTPTLKPVFAATSCLRKTTAGG